MGNRHTLITSMSLFAALSSSLIRSMMRTKIPPLVQTLDNILWLPNPYVRRDRVKSTVGSATSLLQ